MKANGSTLEVAEFLVDANDVADVLALVRGRVDRLKGIQNKKF